MIKNFNVTDYIVDSTECNFYSIGSISGYFNFSDDVIPDLYNYIVNDPKSNEYCFVEKKTIYHALQLGMELDNKRLKYSKVNITDTSKFWKYVIDNILNSLKYYINNKNDKIYSYIYSDKKDATIKLHLYFPNIIVNNEYTLIIRKKTIQLIKYDNIYKLPDCVIDKLFDSTVYKNYGLPLPFQLNNKELYPYTLNRQLSTYKFNLDKIRQLKIISLRRSDESINFKPQLNNNGNLLLDNESDMVNRIMKLNKEWHPTKNGEITFNDCTPYSGMKIWWLCNITSECGCQHEWKATISNRNNDKKPSGCPFCSGRQVCFHDSIYNKHLLLMKEWDFTKNGDLDPRTVAECSNKLVWWICPITCKFGCKHTYQQTVTNKIVLGQGCPYCSPSQQKICYHDSLEYKHPELAQEWHTTKNGDNKPSFFPCGSHFNAWWLCPKKCKYGCLHEYQATIQNKVKGQHNCPYCNKYGVKMCIHDSVEFNCPDILLEWNYEKNITIKPSEISTSSSYKVSWKCKKGHEWDATISNRIQNESGCPFCINKSEQKLYALLTERFPNFTISYNKTFDWCRSEDCVKYRFDFYVVELNLLIELDGEQHFKQVLDWDSPEINQERDVYKMVKAIKNGMRFIRITRTLFKQNKNKLEDILFKHINVKTKLLYICDNDEYDIYKNKLKKAMKTIKK